MGHFDGSCHCGNIQVSLQSSKTPAELGARACGCRFCRRHGAATTSDPDGSLTFTTQDAATVNRYQFGLGITDFLLCARCGVFVGALSEINDQLLGVVNINILDDTAAFTPAALVSFEGETEQQRWARRQKKWTPTIQRIGN